MTKKFIPNIGMSSQQNPSKLGEIVNFIVAVTSPIKMPTGEVSFFNNGVLVGAKTINANGITNFNTNFWMSGTIDLTVRYGGDDYFNEILSPSYKQYINKNFCDVILISSCDLPVFNSTVIFTLTIDVQFGIVSGIVEFFDKDVSLGNINVIDNCAILEISSLTPGTHFVSAKFSGDNNYFSSISNTISQIITIPTQINLNSSKSLSSYSDNISLEAVVNTLESVVLDGMVLFYNNNINIGSSSIINGVAKLLVSTFTMGTHIISAHYNGNNIYGPSDSNIIKQTINKQSTEVVLQSDSVTVAYGQPNKLSAFVSGENVTGTVQFYDFDTPIKLSEILSGFADLNTNILNINIHNISARYNGDENHLSSNSNSIIVNINKSDTAINVIMSNVTINSKMLTAIVTPKYGGVITGSVTFNIIEKNDTIIIGASTVNPLNGRASLVINNINFLNLLIYCDILAVYNGNPNFNSSSCILYN